MDWHKRFLQQAAWTRELRRYLFEEAGFAGARRVLEVGCGSGAVLMDLLPGRAGGGSVTTTVHGLDIDRTRLVEARQHVPEAVLTCGDALRLPYPGGTFEISFCHYLLLWVRDPLQALLEMKRVTRPGGAVLALAEPDHDSRQDEPAALAALGRWQTASLRRQGADPGLGSRLAELFRQAGLPPVEAGTIRRGTGRLLTQAEWELEWKVLEADLAGSVPPKELQRLKNLDEQAWQRGQRLLHVPTHYAWGRV